MACLDEHCVLRRNEQAETESNKNKTKSSWKKKGKKIEKKNKKNLKKVGGPGRRISYNTHMFQ